MPHQCTTCGHTFADGSKEMLGGCPDCGGNTFQFHPAGTDVPDGPPTEEPPEPEANTATERMGRAATKVRDFVGGGSTESAGEAESTSKTASPGDTASAGTTDAPPASDSSSASDAPTASEPTATTADTATDSAGETTPNPDAPWPDDAPPDGPAGSDEGYDSEIIDADARREAAEDRAQSSARGEIASPDEVADGAAPAAEAAEGEPTSESATDPLASGGGVSSSPTGATPNGTNGPPAAEGRVVSEPTGEQPDIEELREQLNDQFESIKIVEPGQYELNLMELYNREEYIIALQENGRYVIQVPENWLGDRPGADGD